MVTPTYAITRIRAARREERPPPSPRSGEYRPEYEAALVAIRDLGGDPAIDDLTDWIVARTHETGRLPPPAAVRKRARAICRERGLEVPDDSPLRG